MPGQEQSHTSKGDSFLASVGLMGLVAWLWLYFASPFGHSLWAVLLFVLWPGSYLILLLMQKLNKASGVFMPFSLRLLCLGVFVTGLTAQAIAGFYIQPEGGNEQQTSELRLDPVGSEPLDQVIDYKSLWQSEKRNADQLARLLRLAEIKQKAQEEINAATDQQHKEDLEKLKTALDQAIAEGKAQSSANQEAGSDKDQDLEIAVDPDTPFEGLDLPPAVRNRLANRDRSQNLLEQLAEVLTIPGRAMAGLLGFGGKYRTTAMRVSNDIAQGGKIPNEEDLYLLFAATATPRGLHNGLMVSADAALARGVIDQEQRAEIRGLLDKMVFNSSKAPAPYVQDAISRIQQMGGCPIDDIRQYDFEAFPSKWTKYEQLGRIKSQEIRQCLDQLEPTNNQE